MMFPQQEQENFSNENEHCKNAMISTKKSTVKYKTIITDAIIKLIVQQYLPLYSLNAILLYCCKIEENTWCGYVVVYLSKVGTCAVLPKTTSDGTEQCYFISYLCAYDNDLR